MPAPEKTVHSSTKIRKINAWINALMRQDGGREVAKAITTALGKKAVFEYVEVYDTHPFYMDREGSRWNVIQPTEDGGSKQASFEMPHAESLHAGNMKAWEVAREAVKLPVGTWVINIGDYYVNFAVTVYKVIAKPIPPTLDVFTLDGITWHESRGGGFFAELNISGYRFDFAMKDGKISFGGLPYPSSMQLERVTAYIAILQTALAKIATMQAELDARNAQQRALAFYAEQNYDGRDNS